MLLCKPRGINRISRALGRFRASQCGNLAVTTALVALPLCIAAGVALDYGRLLRVKAELQQDADSAALAAASASNLPASAKDALAAREKIAASYLSASLGRLSDARLVGSPQIVAGASSVAVTLHAKVDGTLSMLSSFTQSASLGQGQGGNAAGAAPSGYGVTVSSTAGWSEARNYICMMALNGSAASALSVSGTADILSPNCSVQVNSTSSSALTQQGNATINAGQICVAGNYSGGNLTPTPKTSCSAFSDPLASQFASDYTAAYATAPVRYSSKSRMTLPAGTTTLQPGIYESGIRVDKNATLSLQPGIYFIKDGTFEVMSSGIVNGTGGVTIVFTGNDLAYLSIQAKGSLNLKAPASGKFAGLAIAQHPSVSARNANTVIGGGQLNIEGIIYMPKQTFYVTGNGVGTTTNLSTSAKQFAIVADTITIKGNGQVKVGQSADYQAAGLPALPFQKAPGGKVALKQ